MNAQADAIRAARRLLVPSALLVLLHGRPGRDLAGQFWRSRERKAHDALEALNADYSPPGDPEYKTLRLYGVYANFAEWAVYDALSVEQVSGTLGGWTIEFESPHRLTGGIASCWFEDQRVNALYGYKGVPAIAALGARWRQIANKLCAALNGYKGPAPLDPSDCVLDYIVAQVTLIEMIPPTTSARLTLEDLDGLLGPKSSAPGLRAFVKELGASPSLRPTSRRSSP
jgi:hypothetical protein